MKPEQVLRHAVRNMPVFTVTPIEALILEICKRDGVTLPYLCTTLEFLEVKIGPVGGVLKQLQQKVSGAVTVSRYNTLTGYLFSRGKKKRNGHAKWQHKLYSDFSGTELRRLWLNKLTEHYGDRQKGLTVREQDLLLSFYGRLPVFDLTPEEVEVIRQCLGLHSVFLCWRLSAVKASYLVRDSLQSKIDKSLRRTGALCLYLNCDRESITFRSVLRDLWIDKLIRHNTTAQEVT